MLISYLANIRVELCTAVGLLSTKMQQPTEHDMDCLLHLRKYINGTRDLAMWITPETTMQVHASADAAFGVHADGKSVTGMVVRLGPRSAPIIAKHSKQKSVATSSTVAELMAICATTEEVLWIKQLLEDMGVNQDTVEIENDNQAAAVLTERGPSGTGRTKWVNVRYWWVHEQMESGAVRLVYVPSEELIADGFTKPLSGNRFKIWRGQVLNLPETWISADDLRETNVDDKAHGKPE